MADPVPERKSPQLKPEQPQRYTSTSTAPVPLTQSISTTLRASLVGEQPRLMHSAAEPGSSGGESSSSPRHARPRTPPPPRSAGTPRSSRSSRSPRSSTTDDDDSIEEDEEEEDDDDERSSSTPTPASPRSGRSTPAPGGVVQEVKTSLAIEKSGHITIKDLEDAVKPMWESVGFSRHPLSLPQPTSTVLRTPSPSPTTQSNDICDL